jgi:phosphoglycerate dehydrogenase-like enzyme
VKRLVVDLMSSAPHLRLPDAARQRILADVPAGWDAVVISALTRSKGEGSNEISDETLEAARTAEAYFGYGVSEPLLAAAPALRWAHSAAAGVGNSITPTLRQRDIVFTNSAGVYAEPMADTVLGGVLHFARGLDFAVHQQADSRWDQGRFVSATTDIRELNELRILVIGAGGIGSAVAARFTALGCSCTGIRRRPELGIPAGFAAVGGPDDIDRLLPDADVVIVAAPQTAATRAVLDAGRFALLPKGAIVVNVARGALIDDAALLEALDGGNLRGAVLDVFHTEPLPPDSPYWRHPGVLITPHVSGVSPRRQWSRALDLFEDNWRRWAAGAPLRNVVDLDAGY